MSNRRKFDWVNVWIFVLVFGGLSAIGIGVAVELLKLAALVKYVFS